MQFGFVTNIRVAKMIGESEFDWITIWFAAFLSVNLLEALSERNPKGVEQIQNLYRCSLGTKAGASKEFTKRNQKKEFKL